MMPVLGVVLAGGLSRRMGNIDKGLVPLQGRPLVAHVVERLRPQVDAVLINANRNLDDYAATGCRVVPDRIAGYAGPLAGLDAGLHAGDASLVVTVPCDSPFLPLDLVARLRAARDAIDADVAVPKTGDWQQPVFALVHVRVRDHLEQFLARGERKFDRWYSTLRVAEVAFDDQPQAFVNINTREELQQHER